MTQEIESEVQTMCSVSQGVLEKGIQKGTEETLLKALQNLMKSGNQSAEQAMTLLGVPLNERSRYREMLRN